MLYKLSPLSSILNLLLYTESFSSAFKYVQDLFLSLKPENNHEMHIAFLDFTDEKMEAHGD